MVACLLQPHGVPDKTKKSAATSKISFASYLPRDKDIAGAMIGVPRVVCIYSRDELSAQPDILLLGEHTSGLGSSLHIRV